MAIEQLVAQGLVSATMSRLAITKTLSLGAEWSLATRDWIYLLNAMLQCEMITVCNGIYHLEIFSDHTLCEQSGAVL